MVDMTLVHNGNVTVTTMIKNNMTNDEIFNQMQSI